MENQLTYYILWWNKDQWEIIYYVAFIVLTLLIVWLTAKTYLFQSKKSSQLFCKCNEVMTPKGNSNLYLEVYNFGNTIAKDIKVNVSDKTLGTIPFLKPSETYSMPIAYFIIAGEYRILQSDIVKKSDNNTIQVELITDKEANKFSIDISILMSLKGLPEIPKDSQDKIISEIKSISKSQDKTTAEVKKIADALSKLKR